MTTHLREPNREFTLLAQLVQVQHKVLLEPGLGLRRAGVAVAVITIELNTLLFKRDLAS
jgi:hypothetical protein